MDIRRWYPRTVYPLSSLAASVTTCCTCACMPSCTCMHDWIEINILLCFFRRQRRRLWLRSIDEPSPSSLCSYGTKKLLVGVGETKEYNWGGRRWRWRWSKPQSTETEWALSCSPACACRLTLTTTLVICCRVVPLICCCVHQFPSLSQSCYSAPTAASIPTAGYGPHQPLFFSSSYYYFKPPPIISFFFLFIS